jgi:hypothetical protein
MPISIKLNVVRKDAELILHMIFLRISISDIYDAIIIPHSVECGGHVSRGIGTKTRMMERFLLVIGNALENVKQKGGGDTGV